MEGSHSGVECLDGRRGSALNGPRWGGVPEDGDRVAAWERVRKKMCTSELLYSAKYFTAKIRELPAHLAGR